YPVYAGPAVEMLPYFARHGHRCPTHANPADFALDLVTVDLRHEGREAASREKVRRLVDAWSRELEPGAAGPRAEPQPQLTAGEEEKESVDGGGSEGAKVVPADEKDDGREPGCGGDGVGGRFDGDDDGNEKSPAREETAESPSLQGRN